MSTSFYQKLLMKKSNQPGGIYIHLPFCASRCGYCSFFTAGLSRADWPAFVAGILAELDARLCELPNRVQTIYFGGGTPSAMPARYFEELAQGVANRIEKAGSSADILEFTIEANPDDVTGELADAWLRNGVNRVSLGVQSFIADELKTLYRAHNPLHVADALAILHDRFENISLDLIFGLPGQRTEDWDYNLGKAIEASPTHLSAYSLSYEERSLLTYKRDRAEIAEISDIDSEAMYNLLLKRAREAGFRHYEVSNFAKPGFESIHNSSYWKGLPYLGLGPSASSYDGISTRRTNGGRLHNWTREATIEHLTQQEQREEYILTRIRRAEGIDLKDYGRMFGRRETEFLLQKAAKAIAAGLIASVGDCLVVTDSGWMVHDNICVDLI